MKIEVWSDYVCPFCYIGKRLLEQALEDFDHQGQVEVEFKSFELDPNAVSNVDKTLNELIAKKYGTTVERAKEMNDQIIERAKTVGLDYNFDQIKQTNTLDAHRLAKLAVKQGKAKAFNERLLKAHFIESQFIGSHDTLIQLAEEVGLNLEEVKQVLSSHMYEEAVRADELEAQQIGVKGVPFFVFNRKYAISGAQPLSLFKETLEQVWQEENQTSQLKTIQSDESAVCTDDGCEIK
jgi:predicted DsbA family dithiol-disulfide isomerase